MLLSNAITLLFSFLLINIGQCQPINKRHFKIALQKNIIQQQQHQRQNETQQQTVSFLAKQMQTAYNHGSGK
jgi:hypothetical protein